MKGKPAILFTFIVSALPPVIAKAQDPHFSTVQDLNTWYNPSLKTSPRPQACINIRSVNYQGIVAYTAKSASIDLPLVSNSRQEGDIAPFANVTVGISSDNAGDGSMKISTALLTFSYALPLSDDNTYLAAGFQGNYTFYKAGLDGNLIYPLQFDKYGSIGSALAADPYQSGYQYGYFNAGAGASIFHEGEQKQWYLGTSIRHFNKPVSEFTHGNRLSANISIQSGYTASINEGDALGGYAIFSWQKNIQEQLIGARYTHQLGDSVGYAISFSAACRLRDALIPGVWLKFGKGRLGFSYEFGVFAQSGYYHRNSFEFSFCQQL